MIDIAINHIAGQLNDHLKRTYGLSEDVVVLSNIVEQDGNLASNIENKLLVFLTSIEKDTLPHRQVNEGNSGSDRSMINFWPVYLNLYVMFAGNFGGENYSEALKLISNTVSFFQRHPVFDHQNSPDLGAQIDQLVLDIENLSVHDLSNLWGILSTRYLPSILYKVRMVAYDSGEAGFLARPVTEVHASAGPS